MSVDDISEELEEWIVSSLVRLGLTVPKLKKVKSLVYKQNHKIPHGKIFGVMLSQQLSSDENNTEIVPKFLLEATSFLIPHLNHKCLFRKRGQDSRIKKLRERIEAGGRLDETVFVDDVATLIKAWLRELPVPVIPNEFHDLILNCHKLCIDGKNMPLLLACSLLPKPHLDTLKFLLNFLAQVAWNSVANCMDSQSLSIVFGPNLIRGDLKLIKNEKNGLSAEMLKEKEVHERRVLEWMINHSNELSKLPESIKLIASLSNELDDDFSSKKKRRKSMSGFTELVGCKIKKMVTNQDKTPTITNSSRRKSMRKSQRTKAKMYIQNGDGKKPEVARAKSVNMVKTVGSLSQEPSPALICSPITNENSTKCKEQTVATIHTPVTRSQSGKKVLGSIEKEIREFSKSYSVKKKNPNRILQSVAENGITTTPVTRSQSYKKLASDYKNQSSVAAKRKSRSEASLIVPPNISSILEASGLVLSPHTPMHIEACEVASKIAKINLNSSLKRSGSIQRARVTKSGTLRRGRPNTVKTGLSVTRKPKIRSNSSVSSRGSVGAIKIARRSRSSTNFSINEVNANISEKVLCEEILKEVDVNSVANENQSIKKKLDFSASFEMRNNMSFSMSGNEFCGSLGFSPILDQNTNDKIEIFQNGRDEEVSGSTTNKSTFSTNEQSELAKTPAFFETPNEVSESTTNKNIFFTTEQSEPVKTPAFFATPNESPILPAKLPRTRSKTKMSSTPTVKWTNANEFDFSKSQEEEIVGSKRDSIIKLREMNAGKVLASVHLYNAIEKSHVAQPSPVRLGTFERNAIASKSVRDRKELFKDAQGFLIPRDFPSSIKRPGAGQRLMSRTPDSPIPRNWHKKKNASAELLYVN